MPEIDGSSKPPQISEMFQKFALAFKTKTFELFADDGYTTVAADDSDGFSLLDSAEEIITDQKVVVIKPDSVQNCSPELPPSLLELAPPKPLPETQVMKLEQTEKAPSSPPQMTVAKSISPTRIRANSVQNCSPESPPSLLELAPPKPLPETRVMKLEQTEKPPSSQPQLTVAKSISPTRIRAINTQLTHTLISSIFATIASFEASYFQLQAAHVPFVEENAKAADRVLVSHLQRLSDFKRFYKDCRRNPDFDPDFPIGSCLEAQVEENQSKLRTLGTVSNRLQAELEQKNDEVSALRDKLEEIHKSNIKLSKKLCGNLNSSSDVLLTVRVFDSVLHDASRATHKFTKILISLMRKAGWDLDLVANTVHPNVQYAKKGHNQYALLSYVCLEMFQGFDSEDFGMIDSEIMSDGHALNPEQKDSSLKQLLEHVSSNPMELLSINPSCDFSKFCEHKYQRLIHPTMESSIFVNLDQNEIVLKSWRSLGLFYEAFVRMASSIWTLHKLSNAFDPAVEIFQVERGVDFSMVYMEDVTRKFTRPSKSKAKVGFTVVPGFKIGRIVVQSQVYISNGNWTG